MCAYRTTRVAVARGRAVARAARTWENGVARGNGGAGTVAVLDGAGTVAVLGGAGTVAVLDGAVVAVPDGAAVIARAAAVSCRAGGPNGIISKIRGRVGTVARRGGVGVY